MAGSGKFRADIKALALHATTTWSGASRWFDARTFAEIEQAHVGTLRALHPAPEAPVGSV